MASRSLILAESYWCKECESRSDARLDECNWSRGEGILIFYRHGQTQTTGNKATEHKVHHDGEQWSERLLGQLLSHPGHTQTL